MEVILCEKCLEQGELAIPISKINEDNIIEYICIKDNNENHKNFIKKNLPKI